MKIFINEDKFSLLLTEIINEYNVNDGNATANPYKQKVQSAKETLEKLLKINGKLMTNIDNGKDYLTYELYSLANAIGKRYCLCQLLKDGEQYGVISTKPLALFKPKM